MPLNDPREPVRAYTHQSPRDLHLYVATKETLQTDLHVLAQQSIGVEGFDACFQIIGESHHITLSSQSNVVLQELFACTTIANYPACHHAQFQMLKSHHFSIEGYQITVEFSTAYMARKAQLRFDFPAFGRDIPFTEIGWQHTENWLQWWTVHSYPDPQGTILAYTNTKIDLSKEIRL